MYERDRQQPFYLFFFLLLLPRLYRYGSGSLSNLSDFLLCFEGGGETNPPQSCRPNNLVGKSLRSVILLAVRVIVEILLTSCWFNVVAQ